MEKIGEIVSRIEAGERVSAAEAGMLWREAPLSVLGRLAYGIKSRKTGDKVFFNRNFHIEPTNICIFSCRFCAYRRNADSPEAWNYSLAEIESLARRYEGSDVTEVHIVGGVHPGHDLGYYAEMIRRVKGVLPDVAVKAFTAIELAYMIEKAGLGYEAGLRILKDAGMEAIPGGGAEIFDETLRAEICPEKGSSEKWLALHRAAHGLGFNTNATILYGHAETPEQRIDHMERLRRLQDETGGFDAFIPLKYRAANNGMGSLGEVGVTEDMKMLAMSRIFLDNFPHIKAYWVMYGKTVAEMALAYGADDIDGTIDDTTRIYSMAGAEERRPRLTVDEIETMAANAGLRAVERDTFYNEVLR
jgi:radical SAM domain protein, CofH subfamily